MIRIYDKAKGSFTVEAALTMPVILGVIVLSVYISMFAYDRCVIEYVCQTVCADAAFDLPGEEDIEEEVRSRLCDRLAGNWDIEITTDHDDHFAYVTVNAQTPLFGRMFTHRNAVFLDFYR